MVDAAEVIFENSPWGSLGGVPGSREGTAVTEGVKPVLLDAVSELFKTTGGCGGCTVG